MAILSSPGFNFLESKHVYENLTLCPVALSTWYVLGNGLELFIEPANIVIFKIKFQINAILNHKHCYNYCVWRETHV